MSETAQQLELIINMLKAQSASIEETKVNLAAYQAKVTVLESKVTTLEFAVDALTADNLFLKEQMNTKNQEGKLNNARMFGIPHCDEETKATDGGEAFRKLVYDRFLRPCLNAAKANGDIPTVPHAANVISKALKVEVISRVQAQSFFELINHMQAQVVSPAHGTQDVMFTALSACELDLSAYDATYVLLAEHLSCPLATLDKNLRKAAKKRGVAIAALDR